MVLLLSHCIKVNGISAIFNSLHLPFSPYNQCQTKKRYKIQHFNHSECGTAIVRGCMVTFDSAVDVLVQAQEALLGTALVFPEDFPEVQSLRPC